MPTTSTLNRHYRIIDRLRRSPATREEIQRYISDRSAAEHESDRGSRSTFERDKQRILLHYGIAISYRPSDGKYFIDDSGPESTALRLLEAFDLMNLFRAANAHAGQVIPDTRRPAGSEHFYILLTAIQQKTEVRFQYLNYETDVSTERQVKPYALKEFRGRWYLVAERSGVPALRTYGLDRISELEQRRTRFKRSIPFDPATHYEAYFGITGAHDNLVQDVELWFDPLQGAYVKSLPLHASQQLLSDTDDGVRIALKLYITHDFVMELLSYGATLRVIAPESLKTRVRGALQAALDLYKNEGP